MSRRFPSILGFVLLLLLAGCAAAVPLPKAGQLLYVTTFDSFNDSWQLYEGELAAQVVSSGAGPVLQINVDTVQEGAFTVLDQQFSDFDLTVDLAQVAGPEDVEAPGFGVLFRHQDNRNFYTFLISGDGYYQVQRRLDGVDKVLSDWAPTTAINQGLALNRVRVIARGPSFEFFINDVQVPLCATLWNPAVPGECIDADTSLQIVDESLPLQGKIGLGARSFGEAGVQVDFDNLVVCGPRSAPMVPFRCEETGPDA